ncbi:transposase [Streptomyces hirsutus]|uniref:transposase n=1 Tax=Streptomyces hirsutus TaxID=35620 RepID=UPI003652CEC1
MDPGRAPGPRRRATRTRPIGPSPADRRKTGSEHHLTRDGRGTPLKVITTAAHVDDVTRTLALVDGVPPVAGRTKRPRHRPDALPGDKGYGSGPNRREPRKRRIPPAVSREGTPGIKSPGTLRYTVEQTFTLLHPFERLALRRNAEPDSTTPSSPWPAASSAGEATSTRAGTRGGHGIYSGDAAASSRFLNSSRSAGVN